MDKWYKDAVFYELHVRTFKDSNEDGMGDFPGLTSKLDYIQGLGVDCIWLLPFFPSPLLDDGYDVADFYNIHPDLGTIEDFRIFIEEAHKRGIKVIADMLFNHVSSEHDWFKQARSSPDNPKRNWFVWSDNPNKYPEVRIIFTDTETSNWAWDPVANAYYWHRFFNHQPDLNYDNAEVREEMKNVVRFWLNLGLDGFRCDAVPYLFEREGTNGENLPETHQFFKEIRGMMDAEFPGTILLAEANQWPTETIPYFGNGDEFHMAFNFPLMPRIFMALAKEDKQAVVEMISQILNIPESCQWATFLRNHDELTLEMVSEEERAFMYSEYAQHPKMRLNVGIRRRLAPLLNNDRLKMELLSALLLSLPGSPTIYYGDELGMGDNIYLGDRNGVRTAMQWSGDLNAGFSTVDPELLYMPPVVNPAFHYEFINVRTSEKLISSFLNWNKHMLSVRRKSKAFGRGNFRLIDCPNHKIFAFAREYGDEKVLCIFNLSKESTYFRLDLSEYKGKTLVEMGHETRFPTVKHDDPYIYFTLTGFRFLWFKITD